MDVPISYYPILHLPSVKPGSLAVLKKSGGETQKWGVVGADGLFRCYNYEGKALKRNLSDSIPKSGKSEAVVADGDQFYMSFEKEIVEINRKGARKTISEVPFDGDVSHLVLHNGQLVACSGSLCAFAKAGAKTVTLPATITGAVSLGGSVYLGCMDGTVHSFDGSSSKLVASLPGAVTCISAFERTSAQSYLAVGCADFVLRIFNTAGKKVSEVNLKAAATAVASYDFDKDGFFELLVALGDSTVCLVNLALLELPRLISSLHIGFNVSNMAIGVIYSNDMVSAVVASQTGQVGLVFVEPKSDRSVLSGKAPKVTQAEIDELKKKVETLEKQASASKAKANAAPSETNVELKIDPTSRKFVFLVESERPVSRIALSAPMPFKLTTRRDCQCVITLSPPKPGKNGAVVRPLEPSATRVAFDFAYENGGVGELRCFVSFAKNAAVLEKTFTLKPFVFLRKVENDAMKDIPAKDISTLDVSCSQPGLLRSLIEQCFPVQLTFNEAETFSSGPNGSVMSVVLKGDNFVAKSMFLPIIEQLRMYLSNRIESEKASASIDLSIGDGCLDAYLARVQDSLVTSMKAGALYNKLKALQEVKNSSPTAQFGDEETTRILQDAPQIEKKFEECQDAYDAFIDEVSVFYLAMWRNVGIDANNKLPDIVAVLKEVKDAASVKTLLELMKSKPN